MFRGYVFVILFLVNLPLKAQQNDSLKTYHGPDVTVSSYRVEKNETSSTEIKRINPDSFLLSSAYTFTDRLQQIPGVRVLSTGIGISKPVIRGFYGNRVCILLGGLKFDNQQWQEEHGMGLSEMGVGHVEVIKGPMGVLYGSEAMGGVINLVDEEPPVPGKSRNILKVRFHGNTLGEQIFYSGMKNRGKSWSGINLGYESHGDYRDGAGKRVLNSRYDGYYIKGSYGFTRGKWTSENHFYSGFNRYGFIFNDVYRYIEADKRYSRNLQNYPNHQVWLNNLNSQNTFSLGDNWLLHLNAGIQTNQRMENEGSGAISLNMFLQTSQYLLKAEKHINSKNLLVLSHYQSFEINRNFGSRVLVPDANMHEANVSAFLRSKVGTRIHLENSLNIGWKNVTSFYTLNFHKQGGEAQPFSTNRNYFNYLSGINLKMNSRWTFKLNASSGVRVPNLAEFSSDGLHEGVYTYEIGNPHLRSEKMHALNGALLFGKDRIKAELQVFYNRILDYIYLAPTPETWFGFPVFRYRQQNATQYGAEFALKWKLNDWLVSESNIAWMSGFTDDGNYLPFLPPARGSVKFSNTGWNLNKVKLHSNVEAIWTSAQNHTYPGEPGTPAYALYNAGISFSGQFRRCSYTFSATVNNLFDQAYTDPLSRMKYFGLLNPGRNIGIAARIQLN
ncbi:MAG: TonB-dependent receptor [Bacteroidetes bacterium]|nr:TonB-dependent receptor [Bacteroidota bacterium]